MKRPGTSLYLRLRMMRSHHRFCNYTASNMPSRSAMPWFLIVSPFRQSRREAKTRCHHPLKLLESGNLITKSDGQFVKYVSHCRGALPIAFGNLACKSLQTDGRCSCTLSMNAHRNHLCSALCDLAPCLRSANFLSWEPCRCKIKQRLQNLSLV
jgi:hypothetical protein